MSTIGFSFDNRILEKYGVVTVELLAKDDNEEVERELHEAVRAIRKLCVTAECASTYREYNVRYSSKKLKKLTITAPRDILEMVLGPLDPTREEHVHSHPENSDLHNGRNMLREELVN